MKKKHIGLILILVVILSILASFILYNQWPLMTGKKIILDTRPVDPFDLLRGQYMTIGYEISTLNNTKNFKEGDVVYVLLKEDVGGVWRPIETSQSKPSDGDFIRGSVESMNGNTMRVEYGVEQYFFERHADLPTRNITIEVSVADSGRAKIVQLLQNGKPITIEYEEFDIKS